MSCRYIGSELELFAAATNWKDVSCGASSAGFVAGRVLEVGAGIGANLAVPVQSAGRRLDQPRTRSRSRAAQIGERVAGRQLAASTCRVVTGTISSNIDRGCPVRHDPLSRCARAHRRATGPSWRAPAEHLAARGNLDRAGAGPPILCSADSMPRSATTGATTARACGRWPRLECRLEALLMLDCAGFFASLANRALLAAAMPSKRQIAVWDRVLVPVSRRLDRSDRPQIRQDRRRRVVRQQLNFTFLFAPIYPWSATDDDEQFPVRPRRRFDVRRTSYHAGKVEQQRSAARQGSAIVTTFKFASAIIARQRN